MTRIRGIGLALAVIVHAGGCADAGSSSDAFTEGLELGTKATLDPGSGLVLVSFAKELGPAQELFIDVRRGDLTDPSLGALDCSAVARLPVMRVAAGELGASPRAAHGSRTIYGVELTDRTLLEQAYSDANLPAGQSWAHAEHTAEMQAVIDRGIDSYIDICVTQDGRALRREQVDLFLALDLNNPHLVRDAMMLDQTGPSGAQSGGAFDHNQARAASPLKYAEICVAALGEIPFFGNKRQVGTDPVTGRPQFAYDTYDCLDSVHIPMTVTTRNGDGSETVTGPAWDEESGGGNVKCDRRQYIYDLCEQGPRVVSARNEQGTHWVLLCRKGRGQTPKLEQQGVDANGNPILVNTVPRDQLSSHFNDVAMLGHNPRTGRTCFFQNALYSRHDGAAVPHPGDTEKTQNMWNGVYGAEGGINCHNCHDSDPFILSPWIAGAKRDSSYRYRDLDPSGSKPGTPVVPMMGVHPDLSLKDLEVPYTLVNYAGQGWTHQKQLVGAELKGCNGCHRIGNGNTLSTWALRTVGLDSSYNQMITDAYRNDYQRSHYMPFDPNPNNPDPLPPANQWETSIYGTAVSFIQRCRGNTSDPGCIFKDMPRETAEIGGGAGECWSPIADDCDY